MVILSLYSCFLLPGDRFISKQVDKNKKRKLQKVEHKMLGWGRSSHNYDYNFVI